MLGISHTVTEMTLAGVGRRAEGSWGLSGGLFMACQGRSLKMGKSIAWLSCKGSMAMPQK